MKTHAEGAELAEQGLEQWTRNLPEEDANSLVDCHGGTQVQWVPGEGWRERAEPSRPVSPMEGAQGKLSRRALGATGW